MDYTTRNAKVAEIAAYIRDHLKDPDIAESLAEELMQRAEDNGRFDGDEVQGEVPSRYTVIGNPLPFTI